MATAAELLAAELCEDVLVVDLDSRTIIIPKHVTNIGVESDDGVRILHFQVPRMYCNVDLSTFVPRINYTNAKKMEDVYDAKNVTVEDDVIKFDWIVGRNAVSKKGNVTFIVCMKEVDDAGEVLREFNTTLATLPVLEGLETGEAAIEEYHDIFEQWRSDLFGVGDTVEQSIRQAGEDALTTISDVVGEYVSEHAHEFAGPKGDDGVTFTPDVDDEGNLSWSNDGGLANPEPRNIMGPKGEPGTSFTYDMFTEEQLANLVGPKGNSIVSITRTAGTGEPGTIDTYTITFTDGTATTFDIYNGADGEARDGVTFTPDVDDEGNISWSNDGGLVNPQTRNITGPRGEPGAPFTYDMFTEEQLAALVGPPGNSIASIDRTKGTGAPGTIDTYTITLTDGSKTTFTVYNGANGEGAGDMNAVIYDPQGKAQDIFAYVDDKTKNLGEGNMKSSTYDPTGKAQDIFAYVDDKTKNLGNMDSSTYDPTGKAQDIFAYVDDKVGDIDSILDAINGES